MAETSTAVEIVKLIQATILAVKDTIFSIAGMTFVFCVSIVGAFVPLSWWNNIRMPKVGSFCIAEKEWFLLGMGISFLMLALLVILRYLRKRGQEKEFVVLMSSLNLAEVKALCNAFHYNGKYSLPSCAVELESLRKHNLIIVSPEPGNFGGQEFVLSHTVSEYLREHGDYFIRRGVKPDPPIEDRLPYFAIV